MRTLFAALAIGSLLLLSLPSPVIAQGDIREDPPFEATVVKLLENSEIIESDGTRHPYQKIELIGTQGKLKGKSIIIEHGKQNQVGVVAYKPGDKVIVTAIQDQAGNILYRITDYVRRDSLIALVIIFIILTILIGGIRGAKSLIGMGLTFALLFFFVLPQLLMGANPILITSIASVVIVPVTFYLSHGFNKKTLCAIIGTFIALSISCILAQLFITQTYLSGFASEEAGFLDVMKKGTINIQGLLFAGIVIALLGILEDITISQAAIVQQLNEANKNLGSFDLFRRAMDVGRDHIASMANTLILVYAGASLPLLLLFINNPLPIGMVINNEVIAEEIVRTLVASIGLILAVPVTTAIASFVFSKIRIQP